MSSLGSMCVTYHTHHVTHDTPVCMLKGCVQHPHARGQVMVAAASSGTGSMHIGVYTFYICVQTLWAIDKDWENDIKTGSRRPAATQYPFDAFMDGYGCTHIREAVSLEELAEGENHNTEPSMACLCFTDGGTLFFRICAVCPMQMPTDAQTCSRAKLERLSSPL